MKISHVKHNAAGGFGSGRASPLPHTTLCAKIPRHGIFQEGFCINLSSLRDMCTLTTPPTTPHPTPTPALNPQSSTPNCWVQAFGHIRLFIEISPNLEVVVFLSSAFVIKGVDSFFLGGYALHKESCNAAHLFFSPKDHQPGARHV